MDVISSDANNAINCDEEICLLTPVQKTVQCVELILGLKNIDTEVFGHKYCDI